MDCKQWWTGREWNESNIFWCYDSTNLQALSYNIGKYHTTAGEWNCARASVLTPNRGYFFGKRKHKGATTLQGLCSQWVEILLSASPHTLVWNAWEQHSRKANRGGKANTAAEASGLEASVRQVGTSHLNPGNVVWLGSSSSLKKKDASSSL